ncbi:MAG: FecR domain-containing protein [Verrucomicrobiota bacterium]
MSSLRQRVLTVLGLMLLPVVGTAALQDGKVLVGNLTGSAFSIDAKKARKPLTSGFLFSPAEGYHIETAAASTAELILSNGSTLIVSPESLIEVKTFRQVASSAIVEGSYQKFDKEPSPSVTEIEVKRGKVVGEVRKLSPLSSYVIKTPVGMARIRGTVFTVGFIRNANGTVTMSIACARGSVEAVVYEANTGPVTVAPGKQLDVTTKDPGAAATVNNTVIGATGGGGTGPAGSTSQTSSSAPSPVALIELGDMNSAQLTELADILQGSGVPVSIVAAIRDQASLAPPPPAPGEKAPVTVIEDKPPAQVTSSNVLPPNPAMSSSSGGGGGGSVASIGDRIAQTLQRLVEQEVVNPPVNPTPTM